MDPRSPAPPRSHRVQTATPTGFVHETAVIDCRVRFQTVEINEDLDIHVRSLRTLQEFDEHDGRGQTLGISSAQWPIFGVLWKSSLQLAVAMAKFEIDDRRILEIGCGLGLASLVLNSRGADITATDRHPCAQEMLDFNVDLNGGPSIPFVRADWATLETTLSRYDLIIGSDLMYERGHAEAVSSFIGRHAKPSCETLLADPGRKQCGRYDRCMRALGFSRRLLVHPPNAHEAPPGLQMLLHGR